MLLIILNWLFILLTTFCLGFAFSRFVARVLHYEFRYGTTVLMTGMILATVYAEAFSLFYKVGLLADLILAGFSLLSILFFRKEIRSFLGKILSNASKLFMILTAVLFVVWAFFTSRGYCVPDMNLYHGQSIHWIEEYGVVKGLGNIHSRFAYNSSIFATSALYGMSWLVGQSLHAVNGFLAFLMSVEALRLGRCFSRKKMLLSDFARAGLVYYLTLIWDEIIAPSSDYAVMLTIFFVIISWLECLEGEEKNNITPYSLLCVAGVHALSLKLTAGVLFLLLIKPAYQLLKEKRWKEIAIYFALGIGAAFPWIARTVIISGWLFYPFSAIDLFEVEWKMRNVALIDMDAKLIAAWARGTRSIGVDVPIATWYPMWFKNELSMMERLLVIADLLVIALTVVRGIFIFVRKQFEKLDEELVLFTLSGCYLFWQVTAPMMRYGYAHVLLLCFVGAGLIVRAVLKESKARLVVYALLLLFGCYKCLMGALYLKSVAAQPYYVRQQDYARIEGEEYRVGNAVFYLVPEGYPAGYDPFPVYSAEPGEVELMGDSIKDGFRMVQ